jgi:hypothetical protein
LQRERQCDAHRHAARRQPLAQRHALEQLRHDVRLTAFVPDIEDGKQRRVIDGCGRAGFLLETAPPIRMVGQPARDYLDSDVPPQAAVPRAIYLSHPSCADGGDDFIRTDPCSGRERHKGEVGALMSGLYAGGIGDCSGTMPRYRVTEGPPSGILSAQHPGAVGVCINTISARR